MFRRALTGYDKAMGINHTSTLDTVYNLGDLYSKQGKYAEAEKMYRQALDVYTNAQGSDHPRTRLMARTLSLLLERKSTPKEG